MQREMELDLDEVAELQACLTEVENGKMEVQERVLQFYEMKERKERYKKEIAHIKETTNAIMTWQLLCHEACSLLSQNQRLDARLQKLMDLLEDPTPHVMQEFELTPDQVEDIIEEEAAALRCKA